MDTTNLEAREVFEKFGQRDEPIIISCEHCRESIASDMKWCCGYCGQENRRTRIDSFLNRCMKCKRPPRSYLCPHCSKINFLDNGKDGTHPATKTNLPLKPSEDPDIKKQKEHEQVVKDRKRAIEVAEMDGTLAALKATIDGTKQKSSQERIEEKLRNYLTALDGNRAAVKKLRAEIEEKNRDDPDEIEALKRALDVWLENRSLDEPETAQ